MTPVAVHVKRFVMCPNCGKSEHQVEHLFGAEDKAAGPWPCYDCGKCFALVAHADGQVSVESTKGGARKVRVVLEIPAGGAAITLIVKGIEIDDGHGYSNEEEQNGQHEYFYNEGTCFANVLRSVESVHIEGDDFPDDPHGVATFVRVERPVVLTVTSLFDIKGRRGVCVGFVNVAHESGDHERLEVGSRLKRNDGAVWAVLAIEKGLTRTGGYQLDGNIRPSVGDQLEIVS